MDIPRDTQLAVKGSTPCLCGKDGIHDIAHVWGILMCGKRQKLRKQVLFYMFLKMDKGEGELDHGAGLLMADLSTSFSCGLSPPGCRTQVSVKSSVHPAFPGGGAGDPEICWSG